MVRISINHHIYTYKHLFSSCMFVVSYFLTSFVQFSSLFLTNLLFYAGYVCAEYSKGGKRIQGNKNAACKHCPSYYPSNESFKCKLMFVNAKSITHDICLSNFSMLFISKLENHLISYMAWNTIIHCLFDRSRMLWVRQKCKCPTDNTTDNRFNRHGNNNTKNSSVILIDDS